MLRREDLAKPYSQAHRVGVEGQDAALTAGAMATHSPRFMFKVLTVNIHKGFTFFNRKFMLHELREAVRSVASDVVFLQEVHGTHTTHPRAPCELAGRAALRVPGRHDLAAVRVWPQRGLPAR